MSNVFEALLCDSFIRNKMCMPVYNGTCIFWPTSAVFPARKNIKLKIRCRFCCINVCICDDMHSCVIPLARWDHYVPLFKAWGGDNRGICASDQCLAFSINMILKSFGLSCSGCVDNSLFDISTFWCLKFRLLYGFWGVLLLSESTRNLETFYVLISFQYWNDII